MTLLHLKEEVRNEVRDLIALVGLNTTLTNIIYLMFLPPLNLFLSQYRIHTKLFSSFD